MEYWLSMVSLALSSVALLLTIKNSQKLRNLSNLSSAPSPGEALPKVIPEAYTAGGIGYVPQYRIKICVENLGDYQATEINIQYWMYSAEKKAEKQHDFITFSAFDLQPHDKQQVDEAEIPKDAYHLFLITYKSKQTSDIKKTFSCYHIFKGEGPVGWLVHAMNNKKISEITSRLKKHYKDIESSIA